MVEYHLFPSFVRLFTLLVLRRVLLLQVGVVLRAVLVEVRVRQIRRLQERVLALLVVDLVVVLLDVNRRNCSTKNNHKA